jgi:tetratricopeptide (TPR) repeat protein
MAGDGGRLTGWKAIAGFLAVDVRTARRWEAERGLPVHRLPGAGRSAVWADPGELRGWMSGPPAGVAAAPVAVPVAAQVAGPIVAARPMVRAGRAGWAWLVAAGVSLAIVAMVAVWPHLAQPTAAAPFADEASNRLWLDARHAAASRTPAGLEQAAGLYADLARRHPRAAPPQAGLAETWLLMREFAGLADEVAFRRARDAAEAALAIDPDHPAAQRALGFVLFWSEVDQPRGLALLRSASSGQDDARSLHWLGTALAFSGHADEALPVLEQARLLMPESTALTADEAQVRYIMGQRAPALAALRRLARASPGFIGAWRYLEWDLLAEGDAAGFLQAARAHARLRGDAERLALLDRAEAAFRAEAMPGLLAVLIAAAERHHRDTGCDAIAVARLHALAGDRAAVRRWVVLAQTRKEPFAHMLAGWPELRPLKDDPALADLFARRPG